MKCGTSINPSGVFVSFDDVVPGETIACNVISASYSNPNAGSQGTSITIELKDATPNFSNTNYNLTTVMPYTGASAFINKKPLTDSEITINPSPSVFTYDGHAKTPLALVSVLPPLSITAGDYIVSYDNNTEVGTATMVISARETGNYSGVATRTFTITDAETEDVGIVTVWSNEHGELAESDKIAAAKNEEITFELTSEAAGFSVEWWEVNGIRMGSGNTFEFKSENAGTFIIGLFVSKGGLIYNTNITITVME